MARISRKKLLAALRTHSALANVRKRGQANIPAVLIGLADVESNFRLDVVVDDGPGNAHGLWQINDAFWDAPDALDLEGNIRAVVPVIEDANKWVGVGLRERIEGSAGRDAIGRPTQRQIDLWYSIIWQYGSGTFLRWIRQSDVHSVDGFFSWRQQDSPNDATLATYKKRQRRYLSAVGVVKKGTPEPEPQPDFQKTPGEKVADFVEDVGGGFADAGKDVAIAVILGYALVTGVVAFIALEYLGD